MSSVQKSLAAHRRRQRQLQAAIDAVDELFSAFAPGYRLSLQSRISVGRFIERLTLAVVIDAMEVACARLAGKPCADIFKYFCGVCWTKIRMREDVVEKD